MNHDRFRTSMIAALMMGLVAGGTAPAAAQELTTLPLDHPEVTVVGVNGARTTGTLRRFDVATVVLDQDGQDVVLQKPEIAQIYEDDPLKNGMLIGLAAGLVVAAVATATADCGGDFFGQCTKCGSSARPMSGSRSSVSPAPIFGGAGLGVGAAIDGLFHRHRMLYVGAPGASGGSLSRVTLRFDRSRRSRRDRLPLVAEVQVQGSRFKVPGQGSATADRSGLLPAPLAASRLAWPVRCPYTTARYI